MWRDNDTGAVVERHDQIRALRPMMSLPLTLTEEAIAFARFSPVTLTTSAYDSLTQKVVMVDPVFVEDHWEQVWAVVDLSPEAIEALLQQVTDNMDAYLKDVRVQREQILNRLAGIGFAAFVQTDQPTVDAVLTARQQLLDITTIPAVQTAYAAGDLIALKAAVKAEYASIVAGVPAALINAFDQVDQ